MGSPVAEVVPVTELARDVAAVLVCRVSAQFSQEQGGFKGPWEGRRAASALRPVPRCHTLHSQRLKGPDEVMGP